MSGYTSIVLLNLSAENIYEQNEKLEALQVSKYYRFIVEEDIAFEYNWFLNNDDRHPESLFPREKIKSYSDFKNYWNPWRLGWGIVSPKGVLSIDLYFGRTPEEDVRAIGKYIAENIDNIAFVSGCANRILEVLPEDEKFLIEKNSVVGEYKDLMFVSEKRCERIESLLKERWMEEGWVLTGMGK